MLFSLYPTDPPSTRQAVAQAAANSPEKMVFTSLHIPESSGLRDFGDYLQSLHDEYSLEFCADISPLTLERLGIGLDGLDLLKGWGVAIARIDFGFEAGAIKRIAEDFTIAVNASTADSALLDSLDGTDLVGWHNYYPRPETGITASYYRSQNTLFEERGLPIYSFIPGETTFRAPLHRGLPLIEKQRYRNSYLNYAQVKALSPQARVVCAEGTLLADHQAWITVFEQTGVLTLPLTMVDSSARFLFERSWRVRGEVAAASWRLEDTRSSREPASLINADARWRGSVQMDLPFWGRYQGEIHIMREDRPLGPGQARVAEIGRPYEDLVDYIRPHMTVAFAEAGHSQSERGQ